MYHPKWKCQFESNSRMSQSDHEFDETALLEESDAVDPEADLSYENGNDDENDPVWPSWGIFKTFLKNIK